MGTHYTESEESWQAEIQAPRNSELHRPRTGNLWATLRALVRLQLEGC